MGVINSAFGNYIIEGNPHDADVVIGHSFGTSIGQDDTNGRLAQYILETAEGRPIIADHTLAAAFVDAAAVDYVVEGDISSAMGKGLGSWQILVEAQSYMATHGLERPMMVAQAYHIGRVAMQAKKLGMQPIVPDGLPSKFDAESEQLWTRSLSLWVPRELLGSIALRAQHKL